LFETPTPSKKSVTPVDPHDLGALQATVGHQTLLVENGDCSRFIGLWGYKQESAHDKGFKTTALPTKGGRFT